jgi:hypothetical protein
MKIEIKGRHTNEVIFTHEQENNTINATVEVAVKLSINLRYANLEGANLEGAYLVDVIGNSKEIKTIICSEWSIVYTNEIMKIGCQEHLIKDWFEFDDDRISSMHSSALVFWQKWKPILKLIIEE